mmetsp:Transcript_8154/g.23436  ORF Transcript_8154/g.23436 Transcript_8154/m.23436 type:complete len:222 (+) Transcript_8154:164-829(+)|eukprot:CAMPEP_0119557358 /NCGR_PEP_ID=MMETSP1352-20130426/9053_1 /TAXON_ID=265584 /ORGANISM="Stauroneis constricta, Strain CCMP1120" /LENGTH=221 /DNA_ID=CAMNT_0007604453 /DNA_START=94 /DNA_END=759 /DNA_ORIENTATION=+
MPATSVITINDGTKVVFDSLPYIDQVHQDYEDYALALIDDEMSKVDMEKIHPRVQEMKICNRTSILKTECETATDDDGEFKPRNHLKIVDQLDKGIAPGMEQDENDDDGMDVDEDVRALRKEIRHARARYEAERLRHQTLEAEKGESTKNWKACVDGWLKGVQVGQNASLKRQRDAVEEVNFQREQLQTNDFGPQFQELEQQYREAVHRRNQYEQAVAALK